jgi:hypothetical protein
MYWSQSERERSTVAYPHNDKVFPQGTGTVHRSIISRQVLGGDDYPGLSQSYMSLQVSMKRYMESLYNGSDYVLSLGTSKAILVI